jgi:outer membrane cobalamin receptor
MSFQNRFGNDSVNSSQEILRKVPGLFIGQHAGGGKAEQIFLRGFDIDHGTDTISVDDACKYGLSCTWSGLC